MAQSTSNFNLVFTAGMSVIFMVVALGTLLKSHESIVTQLGYESLFIFVSPIVTLNVLVIKIFFPKWWKDLDLPLWKKVGMEVLFETVLTMGSRICLENSKVGGWDLIFSAFAFALQFVAGSFVTGQRFNFAALVTGSFMLQSGVRFSRQTGSVITFVVVLVMFTVVFVGVKFANPYDGVHEMLREGGGGGDIKWVKVSEIPVKVSESKRKSGENFSESK